MVFPVRVRVPPLIKNLQKWYKCGNLKAPPNPFDRSLVRPLPVSEERVLSLNA